MSADNWDVCPRCATIAKAAFHADELAFATAYGHLSENEYTQLRIRVHAGLPEPETTLREDYGFVMSETGGFEVYYTASCECGFSHRFRQSEQVDLNIEEEVLDGQK